MTMKRLLFVLLCLPVTLFGQMIGRSQFFAGVAAVTVTYTSVVDSLNTDNANKSRQSQSASNLVGDNEDTTATLFRLGENAGEYVFGMIFSRLAIPQGKTIDSARIWLMFGVPQSWSATLDTVRIYGYDADNVSLFGEAAHTLVTHGSLTSSSLTWQFDPASYTDLTLYPGPLITSLVNTIVNKAGYTSGNKIGFYFIRSNTGANRRMLWRGQGAGLNTVAKLTVTYH